MLNTKEKKMKTKMIWFLIGFVVSWMTWALVKYIRLHPRDYTQSWSESDKEILPYFGQDWLKLAEGQIQGAFEVYTPSASSNASIIIHPPKSNCYPFVWIQDFDDDGVLDSILITDSKHSVTVDDKDGDGFFDFHDYSIKENENITIYADFNMDGQNDMRLDPNDNASIFIDSQWRDLIIKDKKRYVDINGTITQVKAVNGVYRRVVEEQRQFKINKE